jgi:hypothetical protein
MVPKAAWRAKWPRASGKGRKAVKLALCKGVLAGPVHYPLQPIRLKRGRGVII